jgi:hypothetical protein
VSWSSQPLLPLRWPLSPRLSQQLSSPSCSLSHEHCAAYTRSPSCPCTPSGMVEREPEARMWRDGWDSTSSPSSCLRGRPEVQNPWGSAPWRRWRQWQAKHRRCSSAIAAIRNSFNPTSCDHVLLLPRHQLQVSRIDLPIRRTSASLKKASLIHLGWLSAARSSTLLPAPYLRPATTPPSSSVPAGARGHLHICHYNECH